MFQLDAHFTRYLKPQIIVSSIWSVWNLQNVSETGTGPSIYNRVKHASITTQKVRASLVIMLSYSVLHVSFFLT